MPFCIHVFTSLFRFFLPSVLPYLTFSSLASVFETGSQFTYFFSYVFDFDLWFFNFLHSDFKVCTLCSFLVFWILLWIYISYYWHVFFIKKRAYFRHIWVANLWFSVSDFTYLEMHRNSKENQFLKWKCKKFSWILPYCDWCGF